MSALSGIQDMCRAALVELRKDGARSTGPMQKLSDAQPAVVRVLLKKAVQKVTPTIRQMIRAKYVASGLKNRTGKLTAALGSVQVELKFKGTKPVLHVSLPAGLSNDLYAQAASLNYGAVRQPKIQRTIVDIPSNNEKARQGIAGVIGDRAKRTLKLQVTGQISQSNRADTWRTGKKNRARTHEVIYDSRRALKKGKSFRVAVMARTYNNTVVAGNVIEQRNTSTGSFSIIPPRNFFTFTATEKQTIAAMIEAEVVAALQRS